MPRFLYSLILVLIQPLVLLRLWYKGRISPAYRTRISERYGFNAPILDACIWVHAVSVGESITAQALIEHLLANNDIPVLVTTTTPTGEAQIERMFGSRVVHRYMPQDISWCINRLINHAKPRLLLVMETELWPNLIAACARLGVSSMLVNGRLSEKSAAGYSKLGRLSENMLSAVNTLCIQTELERDRFIALGARPERCVVVPSLKFEATVNETHRLQASTLRQQWALAGRFVWIAASTHAGEDEVMLAAHRQLLQQNPNALLLIVPRHPERFNAVAELIVDQGFSCRRFSAGITSLEATEVVVFDVMGQLMAAYGVVNAAFVGGSLNGGGGHNIMEPALWSMPVLSGSGLFNFQAVSEQMQREGGLTITATAAEISACLQGLLEPQQQQSQGAKAYAVAQRNKGGLALTLAEVTKLLLR